MATGLTAESGSSHQILNFKNERVIDPKEITPFHKEKARPLSKLWHRNALIAVAIAGLLIGGAALVMHLGYLPEPTSFMHHFSVSSSALQIAVGGTGGLMSLGGGVTAIIAERRRHNVIIELPDVFNSVSHMNDTQKETE